MAWFYCNWFLFDRKPSVLKILWSNFAPPSAKKRPCRQPKNQTCFKLLHLLCWFQKQKQHQTREKSEILAIKLQVGLIAGGRILIKPSLPWHSSALACFGTYSWNILRWRTISQAWCSLFNEFHIPYKYLLDMHKTLPKPLHIKTLPRHHSDALLTLSIHAQTPFIHQTTI